MKGAVVKVADAMRMPLFEPEVAVCVVCLQGGDEHAKEVDLRAHRASLPH